MSWLLDTNPIIKILKKRSATLAERVAGTPPELVSICSIVEAELYIGAEKYGDPEKRRMILDGFLAPFARLPFDSACVPEYARIRHDLERRGEIIGGNDLMIAAIALTHDLTLVTNNTGEFRRVPGLKIEDWSV